VRPRVLVALLTLAVTAACLIGFSGSSVARADHQPTPPTTTTVPEVQVEGKQVERGPEKDPVSVEEMARTGQDRLLLLVAVALVVGGIGLVLVDVAHTPALPRRQPLPQRTPTWERSPHRSRRSPHP
jgi:hypothetical protein